MTQDSKSLDDALDIFLLPDMGGGSIPSAETFEQKVKRALSSTPGGAGLDRYFGISSGIPEQSFEEALESEQLIDRLRVVTEGDCLDDEDLLNDISLHAEDSLVDAAALRALMRPNKTAKTS